MIEISSLQELAECGARDGQVVRMKPGVYRMSDYLTDARIAEIRENVPLQPGRPPVWMLRLTGADNQFDLRDVSIEIHTALYRGSEAIDGTIESAGPVGDDAQSRTATKIDWMP